MKTAPKNNIEEGKPRPTLLPMDVLLKYLCPAYEEGVIKYERESWREGFTVSVMVDAALRHITEFYWGGENIDKKSITNKHHLAGAIFSLLSILHTLDNRPELDDRFIKGENDDL
ncbi:MAG: dATP/dGTP diphosphohydrolase domain-containing protein [Candidatus Heimdallarchaeaceae archaeon]